MAKFLDDNGLTYLWGKIKAIVPKKASDLGIADDQIRKITVSTSEPSGGNDGDIWIVVG